MRSSREKLFLSPDGKISFFTKLRTAQQEEEEAYFMRKESAEKGLPATLSHTVWLREYSHRWTIVHVQYVQVTLGSFLVGTRKNNFRNHYVEN